MTSKVKTQTTYNPETEGYLSTDYYDDGSERTRQATESEIASYLETCQWATLGFLKEDIKYKHHSEEEDEEDFLYRWRRARNYPLGYPED